MNALCYKIVFSKRLGSLVAVGEHTSGQGKAAGTGVRSAVFPSASAASADNFVGLLKSIFASVALSFVTVGYATAAGPAVNTLPTGYSVNSGNVAISSTSSATNAAMTIKQTTDKASINWQSFSIGSGAAVNIQQNSASSVLLNRVVGNDPSQIFGKLTANGQVILINPNGVVFGKGGSVSASAFNASTFGMTDADFNNGKHKFSRNGSTTGVTVEDGARIDTTGYVALIGASVDNQGAITTQGGAVVLAAGDSVALPSALTDNISVPLSGKVRLELLPSTLNAMVANSGTITTEGGQVLMQAAALSDAVASITHTGTIDTTGAQGGAVTVLADGGVIKATGRITANSLGNDEHGQLRKGGDIIIGRDEETGILAHATDVSGATLISNKGFVETSGDYLATDGVFVKAAEWLLDPSDIIISSGTDAGYTNISGTYTPNSGAASSIVKVNTIKTAIDMGTSVTITTTNTGTSGSGAGNITIASALNFKNISTNAATLSLIADNGIIQNAAITTDATSTGLVHISMEAKGNFQGNTTPSTNSDGININAGISTNGNITLKGSTTKDGNEGVYIGGVTLKANNIDITGTATGAATVPENAKGIRSFGTLDATDKITLKGTSNNLTGVGLEGGSVKAGGAVKIDGITTTGKFQGTNILAKVQGASVTITGNSRDHFGVAIGANVTATNGDVNIKGTSVKSLGVSIDNGKIIESKTANVIIEGTSSSTDGINVGRQVAFATSPEIIAKKDIRLDGKGVTGGVRTWGESRLTAGTDGVLGNINITGEATTGSGVIFQQYGSSAQLNANNNIDVKGTVTGGAGSGSGVETLTSEFNGRSVMFNAGGTFKLTGINTQAANTNNAIKGSDGMQVTAGSHISVIADRQTSTGYAISFNSQTNGVGGNASFKSTNGDVLIRANNGGIAFENAYTGTPSAPFTSSSDISGRNVTIDNTGGIVAVNTTTGKATLTQGTGTSTTNGINLASTAGIKIDATKNINLSGKSTGAAGVALGGPITVKALGGVNIKGTTTSAGAVQGVYLSGTSSVEGKNVDIEGTALNGNGVLSYATIKATAGDANITGTSTGTGGSASALSLWANVTADQNVALKGTNTNTANTGAAVFIGTNKKINATNGKIDVTASTSGATLNALQIYDGAKLTAATEIKLKADTLSISTITANPATFNAGTGKVTITTDSTDAKINIGANDAGSITPSGRTLGLTNAELNRITAGNLEIGDASNTGGITVSSATTTLGQTGHVTLHTAGNIDVNQVLTIDSSKLTLNGAGANSTITNGTSGAIKTSQLELLGANAAVTLDSKLHEVGTLAADVKSIIFANKTALIVGAVNTINSAPGGTVGIKAKDGVSVTTQTGNLNINEAISNSTSGNVVIGAGVSEPAGLTELGDVQTSSGQSVTNTNGQTYIYTGSAETTGKLENSHGSLASLYLSSIDARQQNAVMNTTYEPTGPFNTVPNNTAPVQVMFRDNPTFNATLNTATLIKTFGTADPTDTAIKSAVLAANKSPETTLALSTSSLNTFKTGTAALINSLSGSLSGASGTQRAVGSYDYIATSNNSKINVNHNATSPAIARLNVVPVVSPITAPVVPTSANTSRVKVPVSSANSFALASAENLDDDVCSANSIENCYCEESVINQEVDICYEPSSQNQVKR